MLTERQAWVVVLTAIGGCKSSPSDKVVGWPPTEGGPPYVRDAGAADVAVEVAIVETVLDTAPDGVADAMRGGPCAGLVQMACEFWGAHTDACAEARRRVPDDGHPPTAEACAAIVERFTREEVPRSAGACWRWVAAVCHELGQDSERCHDAKSLLPLAKTKRETHICLGDWIWFEARALRR